MNIKEAINSQLSTTESKKNRKEKNITETESYIWRSFERLSAGRGENGGKGTGNKKHNWWVQNRHGDVKISMGMEKPKNLLYFVMCNMHFFA